MYIYERVHTITESEVEKMRKIDLYWKTNPDWWYVKNLEFHLREDAPKEAKESYERYLKQLEKMDNEVDY